ncbi:hypothetical protein VNO78_19039 [Psophocarpus tetragonolobus]|uniref:Uncharacterized protein n=1 Tax=Psophocarpus tetragonolobus TaxID=3891 RepID=A0AAN9XG12_PSOTE
MLPCLKWGSQRHLRCTNLPSGSPPPREFLGIDAVREKLMLDLKTEADRMKDAILAHHHHDAPAPRTWNLRTRRAPVPDTPSPLRTVSGGVVKSPKFRRSPEKDLKFSLPLSKKEVEEDFLKILGHRPPRRPKRRPRNTQKQLDTLFPGLWLSDINADCYKVPDHAETANR